MILLQDDCRCLGLLPTPTGEQPCAKREACARYLQRYEGKRMAQWLCPTLDDFYGAYIETETEQETQC